MAKKVYLSGTDCAMIVDVQWAGISISKAGISTQHNTLVFAENCTQKRYPVYKAEDNLSMRKT